jgi:hypothetical protein
MYYSPLDEPLSIEDLRVAYSRRGYFYDSIRRRYEIELYSRDTRGSSLESGSFKGIY